MSSRPSRSQARGARTRAREPRAVGVALRAAARSAARSGARSKWQRIYDVVRCIPRARVASYGQVARLAGLPRHARLVGYALHALRTQDAHEIPWQRVVNARGEISQRADPDAALLQRALLEREGVRFDARGRVELARFAWQPR